MGRRLAWRILGIAACIALAGCWSYVSPEAQQRLQSRHERISVTVYPMRVIRGPVIDQDEALARRLVAFLAEQGIADAVLGAPPIDTPFRWGHNQAKMAQASAVAFAATVERAAIGTQYALLVEILCNPTETEVGGVHFYLAERGGQLAAGGLTNSHWDEFKEVRPKDRNGGYEVVLRMLHKGWSRG
jgi:hypothetical protein